MVNPIHSFANSVASGIDAMLRIPGYTLGFTDESPTPTFDLPPQVQTALAEIPDPEQRNLMTLVARGDIVPAGVPEDIAGPDLSRGTAGVTDYLGRVLQALRAAKANPEETAEVYGDEALEGIDRSISEVEGLLRQINPNHPALLGQNKAATGGVDILA
jgi:hypothetical protein